jgi:hypothetical protein
MQYRALVAAASLVLLAGCSTPYQDMGLLGGVAATQIDSTTARISARGNGFTDPATIQNYVLLKAAEVTRANGFDVFVVVNSADATRHGEATFGSANVWGGRGYAFGIGSGFSEEIIKPGEDALIKMMVGPKPKNAPPNVFDANEVIHYVGGSIRGYNPTPSIALATPPNMPPPSPAATPSAAAPPVGALTYAD